MVVDGGGTAGAWLLELLAEKERETGVWSWREKGSKRRKAMLGRVRRKLTDGSAIFLSKTCVL